jgi:hypothetical protein
MCALKWSFLFQSIYIAQKGDSMCHVPCAMCGVYITEKRQEKKEKEMKNNLGV